MRIPYISLLAVGALALSGCAYGGLGYGYDNYGGPYVGASYGGYYDSGYYNGGYYDPGYSGYGYGAPYFGWYNNYYYPGTGSYVYDTYRQPHVMTTTQRSYWSSRSPAVSTSSARRARPNWSGFNRHPHSSDNPRTRPGYSSY